MLRMARTWSLDLSVQRRIAGGIETLLLDQTPVIYPYFCDFLTATDITGVYATGIGDLFLCDAGVTWCPVRPRPVPATIKRRPER
jgi:hypothetical protein